jgi:phenylalanyl-tRNA synthetase beta chain
MTFGFVEAKAAEPFAPEGDAAQLVAVANPLSAKFDTLRPSLLPGLLDAVAHNRRHGRTDVGLFEIGTRFTASEGETRGVALAGTGGSAPEHWSGAARDVDFFDIKGSVELLCDALDLSPTFEAVRVPYLVAGQAARILSGHTTIGVTGQLLPSLVESRGAPRQDAIFVAELNFDRAAAVQGTRDELVRALPRHPFVVRDLSIVVPDTLPAEIIRGTIQAAGGESAAPLAAVVFFDRYKGQGVPDGSISVSVRLTFQAADRTLTDADVQQAIDTILAALVARHGAVQR